MNRIFSLLCAGTVLVSGGAFASEARLDLRGAAIPDSPPVSKYVLKNGLRVLVLRDTRNPVSMVRIRLDAGSNREALGTTGLAHFFEHMMFRKTKFSPEGHYDKTLAGVGGSGNAGTGTDYVVYYSKFPAPALDSVLKLEAERMLGLELREPYFSVEKGAVISERGIHFDNVPAARGGEIVRSIVERGSPYEWPVIGAKQDVENMKIEDVQKFYAAYYVPSNTIISVGGPHSEKEMLALVEKHFGAWSGPRALPMPPMPADYVTRHAGKRFVCSEDVNLQSYSIVYPAGKGGVEDFWYAMAFQDALDDNAEGSFERRLQKSRAASGFAFYKQWWQRPNPNAVAMFSLSPEQDFLKAEALWKAEVESVLKKSVNKRFRDRLVKQTEVFQTEAALTVSSLLELLETNEYYYNNPLATARMESFFRSLNQDNFRRWVAKNIRNAPHYTTGIVPRGKASDCALLGVKSETVKPVQNQNQSGK